MAQGSASRRLAATLSLDDSTECLAGISHARAAALAALGVHTVRDLLEHYPRRYIDMSRVETVAAAPIGAACTIAGTVHELQLKRPKPRLSLVEITLVDGTGTLIVTCFRQDWLAKKVHAGDAVAVSGTVEFNYGFKRMTNPYLEVLEPSAQVQGRILPVHAASAKLPVPTMRRLVGTALQEGAGADDPLPLALRRKYRLMSRQNALACIHFPQQMTQAAAARRRLAFEELLYLELHLMSAAAERNAGTHTCHVVDGPRLRALAAALPFALTEEQQAARDDILRVMAAPSRASHMLLGDVGTGKTVVAAHALAAAADSGGQALMMAPTEVLARQHAATVGPLLDAAGIPWCLLVGGMAPEERLRALSGLAAGELAVAFGTHALLEPDVLPKNCTLVVIDEQQRFGVGQRRALAEKGAATDVLSLTATPIPRTLALAVYGDMTLSYIHRRPGNCRPVQTQVFSRAQEGDAYEVVREELAAGRQAFVVCPLVGEPAAPKKREDDGEDGDGYAFAGIAIECDGDLDAGENPKAAQAHAAYLRDVVFPGARVGLLHGRMSSQEKQQAMQRFREGETDVLVATTVIEVGVDVPNATAMVIEDADRFGLAQLHQLRGRVGRGDIPGRVCLVSGTKAPQALARLQAMERTDDGFALAEYDLSLRREGDILGNRQHGAGVLKLVNVVRDAKAIEDAHAEAQEIVAQDPQLALPEHRALRHELACRFRAEEEGAA